jgi:hypothetical protein
VAYCVDELNRGVEQVVDLGIIHVSVMRGKGVRQHGSKSRGPPSVEVEIAEVDRYQSSHGLDLLTFEPDGRDETGSRHNGAMIWRRPQPRPRTMNVPPRFLDTPFLDENTTTFCGSLDRDLKGFLSFRSANSVDSANGPAAELTALYVEPSAWSNGIGSSLYEQFCTQYLSVRLQRSKSDSQMSVP